MNPGLPYYEIPYMAGVERCLARHISGVGKDRGCSRGQR